MLWLFWLFSHCGWSAGLTFAAAVWKSLYIRSDFSEWFVKGFVCTQGGVGVLWLTQTHAAAQMWSADPRFTLPSCVRCLEERQITAQLCRHKKHGIHNTKPHATCKLHLHSMEQHTNAMQHRVHSGQRSHLWPSWPGFDLNDRCLTIKVQFYLMVYCWYDLIKLCKTI